MPNGELRQLLERIAAIARQQHGVFTRSHARAIGFTRSAIDWRVRRGDWHAVDFGVYVLAGTPPSWNQTLLAACLAGPAVASHRAAAALWRFPEFDDAPAEVTALRHRRRHAPGVVWHESRWLDQRDCAAVNGIPVTKPTRTIIDLGVVCEVDAVTAALDDALRRNMTSVARVQHELDAFGPGRLGSDVAQRALDRRRPGDRLPESVLESAFDALVRRFGLPIPVRQHEIRDTSGALVARVDFAYLDARLAIEIDSVRFHAGVAWQEDLRRQNAVGTQKWRMLRFTHDDLQQRPADVAATILESLQ